MRIGKKFERYSNIDKLFSIFSKKYFSEDYLIKDKAMIVFIKSENDNFISNSNWMEYCKVRLSNEYLDTSQRLFYLECNSILDIRKWSWVI